MKLKVDAEARWKIWTHRRGQSIRCPGGAGPPRAGVGDGEFARAKNNPQVGMANMRAVMPALQKRQNRRSSGAKD